MVDKIFSLRLLHELLERVRAGRSRVVLESFMSCTLVHLGKLDVVFASGLRERVGLRLVDHVLGIFLYILLVQRGQMVLETAVTQDIIGVALARILRIIENVTILDDAAVNTISILILFVELLVHGALFFVGDSAHLAPRILLLGLLKEFSLLLLVFFVEFEGVVGTGHMAKTDNRAAIVGHLLSLLEVSHEALPLTTRRKVVQVELGLQLGILALDMVQVLL